jgi:hypothetical protein
MRSTKNRPAIDRPIMIDALDRTGLDNVESLTSHNPIGLHGLLRGELEKWEYGRRDPSRCPRGILYQQKLVLTSPTSRLLGRYSSLADSDHGVLVSYIYIIKQNKKHTPWCKSASELYSWNIAPNAGTASTHIPTTSRYHQTTGDWDICPSICPPDLMCKCSLDIVVCI